MTQRYTHLHDTSDVPEAHLLIALTAAHHHPHTDAVSHIAGILITTREILTTLEALVICSGKRNSRLNKLSPVLK